MLHPSHSLYMVGYINARGLLDGGPRDTCVFGGETSSREIYDYITLRTKNI